MRSSTITDEILKLFLTRKLVSPTKTFVGRHEKVPESTESFDIPKRNRVPGFSDVDR